MYCRAGQATDVNMEHAHFMPDTKGYKHTLRICNTYCFSTATVVTRKRLNVTLYVHCLYCVYTISGRRSQDQAVALHCHNFKHNSKKRMNSGFSREVDENCAVLGYYAASSGNFLPTFGDNVSIPCFDAGLLARSQYSEGPATGHLDASFSWFPCV